MKAGSLLKGMKAVGLGKVSFWNGVRDRVDEHIPTLNL